MTLPAPKQRLSLPLGQVIKKCQAACDVCRVVLLNAHGARAHPDRLRLAQGAGDEDLGHHDIFVLHRVMLADPELAETELLGSDDELQVLVIALGGGLDGIMERHDEDAGADRGCGFIQAHGSIPWLTGWGESRLPTSSNWRYRIAPGQLSIQPLGRRAIGSRRRWCGSWRRCLDSRKHGTAGDASAVRSRAS